MQTYHGNARLAASPFHLKTLSECTCWCSIWWTDLTRLLQKRNLSFCHINPISKETSISSCNSNFHKTSCGALYVCICAFGITKVGVCWKKLQSIVHFVFANWKKRCWVKMEKWSRTDRQRQGKILDINIEQNCFIYVGSHIMDGKCLHSILSRI